MVATFWMLAADSAAPPAPSGSPYTMMIGMVLMMFVFLWVLNAPRRKEEKRRKEMLANLSKNDRVLTRGGIMGTVVGIKDNDITIKVDESTNTKMTFLRAYIDRVITETE